MQGIKLELEPEPELEPKCHGCLRHYSSELVERYCSLAVSSMRWQWGVAATQ
jgi:hypothetical protein